MSVLGAAGAVVAVLVVSAPASLGRELGLEERVAAQRAIERVYYSHQVGATEPFEEAVSRGLLERKVRAYLKQSAALERYWRTPVTPQALRREMERIRASSRLPGRLREVEEALGGDSILMQECFARPVLVDRLSRSFFAYDRRIHAAAREGAERMRAALVAEGADAALEAGASREVLELVVSEEPGRLEPAPGARLAVEAEELARVRRATPARVGEVGPLEERREAFVVRVLLVEEADHLRVASYQVGKTPWEAWWRSVEGDLDERVVEAVAEAEASLPAAALDGASSAEACGPDDVWDSGSLAKPAEQRVFHAAVWTGSVMLIWGGFDPFQDLDSGLRYDPLTDAWSTTSSANAPRSRDALTAVWTGKEMIVWGGILHQPVDTGGRYDPMTDTWAPTSMAGAPSPRWFHTAVWTGTEMIVWGGFPLGFDTGGRYDPETDRWRATSTVGAPTGGIDHKAVWTGREMIVWGGSRGNTGGRYDPVADTWTPTSTLDAPSARNRHSAVWTGSEMIVWGGSPGNQNTGGRYDPETDSWRPTTTVNAPFTRYDHTAVWTGSEMIVWGGQCCFGPLTLPEGGRYDPVADAWRPISGVNAPDGRANHTAVWTGSLMIVWGGAGDFGDGAFSTGGRYDPVADVWTPTVASSNGPTGRGAHAVVWTGSTMIVWGGRGDLTSGLDTGGRYDPVTDSWSPTSLANAPPPREGPAAVWTGSRMIVWGGWSSGRRVDTGGQYDPIDDTWQPTTLIGRPPARFLHTAVWTGDEMVVWGGDDGTSDLASGGRYDPTADSWRPTSSLDAPSARSDHTAVWTGGRMVVWGGEGGSTRVGSGGLYDPVADAWQQTTEDGAPLGREEHTAVWTGREMIVWGGLVQTGGSQNTGGRYDPVADVWRPTSTSGAPSGRRAHTAVWTGSLMTVWGGLLTLNTGGRYSPALDSWTPITTVDAPAGRSFHTAVWTGSEMIVWGGLSLQDATGGRYLIADPSDADLDGAMVCAGDCDDSDAQTYPGAAQVCGDGRNNDCGHPAWPGLAGTNEADDDLDGFTECGGDCEDADASVRPGAVDLPGDLLDQDCDGAKVCDPESAWRSTGAFVRCVVTACAQLVRDGAVSWQDCDDLVIRAARSGLGRHPQPRSVPLDPRF